MITLGLSEAMREKAREDQDAAQRDAERQARRRAADQEASAQQSYNQRFADFLNQYQRNAPSQAQWGRNTGPQWAPPHTYDPRTDRHMPPPPFTNTPPPHVPSPPPRAPMPTWAVTLGLALPTTRDAAEHAYKQRVRTAHPDAGGSHDAMVALNAAIAAARKALPR